MSIASQFKFATAGAACALLLLASPAWSGPTERAQAKRIHDRIAGVPPSAAVLDQMEADIVAGRPLDAADKAMQNAAFYNVTLKNFVAPWTNRDQTVFAPLNDYTATVIGMVRDDVAFNTALSADILYTSNAGGLPAYSAGEQRSLRAGRDRTVSTSRRRWCAPRSRLRTAFLPRRPPASSRRAPPPRPSSSTAPTARCSASR